MKNLKRVVSTYSEVGPTAPNDSSIALKKQFSEEQIQMRKEVKALV